MLKKWPFTLVFTSFFVFFLNKLLPIVFKVAGKYDFNEVVAMDLDQLDPNVYYIHFTDLFSKYGRAVIINKTPNTFINFYITMDLEFWSALENNNG